MNSEFRLAFQPDGRSLNLKTVEISGISTGTYLRFSPCEVKGEAMAHEQQLYDFQN